jgi:N-acetylglucosaminyl-diphospho-decaprenol L-rhamnosyltransferase
VPSTTVIVVSYRPGPWLSECLASVSGQVDQVILVDNGSSGHEASEIGAAAGVGVHRLETNTGFVGGVNAGLRLTGTEVVGLLNDDAVAGPGWIDASCAALEDPSVGAVGPKIVFADRYAELRLDDGPRWVPGDHRSFGTMVTTATVGGRDVLDLAIGGLYPFETRDGAQWRWTNGYDPVYVPISDGERLDDIRVNGHRVEPSWEGDVINNAGTFLLGTGHCGDFGFETADRGGFDTPAEHFGVTGAAMVVRKATFDRVGGMAPDFFAYYEDADWSWRARLAGYRNIYEPAGTVRHRRSATTADLGSSFVLRLAQRNRLLMLLRNAPLPVALDQVRSSHTDPDQQVSARSLVRHSPSALAWRLRPPRRSVASRRRIFERWAGKNTRWGLPSQAAATTATRAGGGLRGA